MSYVVKILNPKAKKLLQNLADLKLISISESSADSFLDVVHKLRNGADSAPPDLDEINKEVEVVRSKRNAKKKS
jgi:hypothetical protein